MPNRSDMDEALKIHTKYDESDSDSGKSELDEQYYQNKPPPLWIPPGQTVVIRPMNHQYEYLPQQPTTSYVNNNFNPYYNYGTCLTENINYKQTKRPEEYPAQISTQPAIENSFQNKRIRCLPPRLQNKQQEKKENKTASINDNPLQKKVEESKVDDSSVNNQFAYTHFIKHDNTGISEKTNSPQNYGTCTTENINDNQIKRQEQYLAQISTQLSTENSQNKTMSCLPPHLQKKHQEKKENKAASINDDRLQKNVRTSQTDDLSGNNQFAYPDSIYKPEKTRVSEKANSSQNYGTYTTENINDNQTKRPKQYHAQISTQPATENGQNKTMIRFPPHLQKNVGASQTYDLSVNDQCEYSHSIYKPEKTRVSEKIYSSQNPHTVFPNPYLNQVHNQPFKTEKSKNTCGKGKNNISDAINSQVNSNNATQFGSNSMSENVNNKNVRTDNSFWDAIVNCLCCCFC